MKLLKYPDEKEVKYDTKAAKQIFKGEDKFSNLMTTVPRDTNNPIDEQLRMMAIDVFAQHDFVETFVGKNYAVQIGEYPRIKIAKGKCKDVYFHSRDIRIHNKKLGDIIVPFEKVIAMSEREI